jgi:hypothetical protein
VRSPLTDGEAGTMTDVLEFYFDFSSPYGYFASHQVDEVAEAGGRRAADGADVDDGRRMVISR